MKKGRESWLTGFLFLSEFLAWKILDTHTVVNLNYRKRGSASYIVREVHEVRERERERERDTERQREREREIDGSDVTLVALKLR